MSALQYTLSRRATLVALASTTLPALAQVRDLNDAINKAGRQRMLSQRMVKAWLALGQKIEDADGWVLVLPDPEDPICHVWAEGASMSDARRRAQDYVGRIRRLLR